LNILTIIDHKVKGLSLNEEEITFFVHGYAHDRLPDYQIAALLMAIKLKGMNAQETAWLTKAMVSSGESVDLSGIDGITVDKHSTGGVGDKTSLVIGPIVASLGLKLAKMSGRGLGHTGGTIDKLESIPGLSTSLSSRQFRQQVNTIGLAIMGQTQALVPADKKMYALRDVTGTIESIPLISSSIMSKKIASGAKTILLDVKFGSGAFMKTLEDAKQLAHAMVNIGIALGRDTRAMLTDMDQPLGYAIGNRLEVIEAANTLQMKGPKDLLTLSVKASAMMLLQAKKVSSLEEGESKAMAAITSGRAYQKLLDFITAQGGDFSALLNPLFLKTTSTLPILANQTGYIGHIDALALGQIASLLGAGRLTKDDLIDFNAGIILNKKIGDPVNRGDILATLYTNQQANQDHMHAVLSAFSVVDHPVAVNPIIYDWVQS
jgi:pyrimidine-nucleoside phosphorylase